MGVIIELSQVLVVYHLAPLVLVKLSFQQQRGSARGRTHRVRGRISLGRQQGAGGFEAVSDRQNNGGGGLPGFLLHQLQYQVLMLLTDQEKDGSLAAYCS